MQSLLNESQTRSGQIEVNFMMADISFRAYYGGQTKDYLPDFTLGNPLSQCHVGE